MPAASAPRSTWARSLLSTMAFAVVLTMSPSMSDNDASAQAAEATIAITGHGYGHGRGLSQWGSYGYATEYDWDYAQILAHYYSNTAAGYIGDPWISVRLSALDNIAPELVSSAAYTVGPYQVGGGQSAQLSRNSNGTWQLTTRSGCGGSVTGSFSVSDPVMRPYRYSEVIGDMLTTCGSERRTYRGHIGVVWDGGIRVINYLTVQHYLRGVVPRESPASWGSADGGRGMQALMAQSVAARSYAWAENRTWYAKTCDTTSCQVYGGAALDGRFIEDPQTDDAVNATYGQVRLLGGAVARTEFSSSSGGFTAGGTFPAVRDDGDTASPYHNWSTTVLTSSVESAFGVGQLQELIVTSRNGLGADGGRVLAVRVSGTSRSVVVSGDQFRSSLGLRSDWFSFPGAPILPDISPAGIAAVRTAADTGIVFVRATDGTVVYKVGRGGVFGAWTTVPEGTLVGAPAAVSWDGKRVDLFVIGLDGALWQAVTFTSASGEPTSWTPWRRLGGVLTTAPAAASTGNGVLSVTARGTDNALWQLTWDGSVWREWTRLDGLSISAPALEASSSSLYRIRVVGTDGLVWSRLLHWTGGPAGAWTATGQISTAAPSVGATAFWARSVGSVTVNTATGSLLQIRSSLAQLSLGGQATSATATVEWADGTVWTFVRGTDSGLWLNATNPTGTGSTWTSVGGQLA